MCVLVCVNMCVCVWVCVCVCACMCKCVLVCVNVYTYVCEAPSNVGGVKETSVAKPTPFTYLGYICLTNGVQFGRITLNPQLDLRVRKTDTDKISAADKYCLMPERRRVEFCCLCAVFPKLVLFLEIFRNFPTFSRKIIRNFFLKFFSKIQKKIFFENLSISILN